MDNDKVNEALRTCDAIIVELADMVYPERYAEENVLSNARKLRHTRWMIAETLSWPASRLEKKFRWLGFIQGVLWTMGLSKIDELKKMNMPDPIDDAPRDISEVEEVFDHVGADRDAGLYDDE
jgi:hypothetical protein